PKLELGSTLKQIFHPFNILCPRKFHKNSRRLSQSLDVRLCYPKFVNTLSQNLESGSDGFINFLFNYRLYLIVCHSNIDNVLKIFVEENIWGSKAVFARKGYKSSKERFKIGFLAILLKIFCIFHRLVEGRIL